MPALESDRRGRTLDSPCVTPTVTYQLYSRRQAFLGCVRQGEAAGKNLFLLLLVQHVIDVRNARHEKCQMSI